MKRSMAHAVVAAVYGIRGSTTIASRSQKAPSEDSSQRMGPNLPSPALAAVDRSVNDLFELLMLFTLKSRKGRENSVYLVLA